MLTCVAVYNDGSSITLWQSGQYSSEHIDRSRLESIIILGSQNRPIVVQLFEPGQKLIIRRRIEQQMGGAQETVILLGWQTPVAMHLSAIFEHDEHIESTSRFKPDHRWLYEIVETSVDNIPIGVNLDA